MLKGKRVASMVGYVFVAALCAAYLFSSPVEAAQKGGVQNVGGSNGEARASLQEKGLQAVEQSKRLDALEKEFGEHRAAEKEQREGVKDAREALDKRLDKRIDDLQSRISDVGSHITWIGFIVTVIFGLAAFLGYKNVEAVAIKFSKKVFNMKESEFIIKAEEEVMKINMVRDDVMSIRRHIDTVFEEIGGIKEKAVQVLSDIEDTNESVNNMAQVKISQYARSGLQVCDGVECADEGAGTSMEECQYTGVEKYRMGRAALANKKYYHAISFFDDAFVAGGVEDIVKARALNSKGFALSLLGMREDQIETIDLLIRLYGESSDAEMRVQIARALYNKGVAFTKLERPEDAIIAYEDVLCRFNDCIEPEIQVIVAKAIVNMGVSLRKAGRFDEAISAYNDVCRRFGDSAIPAMQIQMVMALYNKSVALYRMGNFKEGVSVCDEVLNRFGEAKDPALLVRLAKVLFSKAVMVGKMGCYDKEISIYDEMLRRFGDSNEPDIMERLAKSLVNKGLLLKKIGRINESSLAFEEVVHRFGNSSEPSLLKQVSKAHRCKSSSKTSKQ